MTRVVPAEPVVPEDQVARAVGVTQEARADLVELVVPVDLVEPVVPEALEDRVVVDPAALVEVQVDLAGDRVAPAATSNAAVSGGRL